MVICEAQKEEVNNDNRQNTRKILFIASIYAHFTSFHIPFMKLLQEMGYDIHAAASSTGGHKEEVESAGVTCWEIPFARSPYSPANVQAFRQLKALLKAQYFDLIHVHTPVAAFLGRYLAKATRQGAVLYTAHGFHFCRGAPLKNWLIYYTAERIAARWTDGLIVLNDEDFKNARRLGFQPEINLFYVHGVGVELNRYSPSPGAGSIRAELGLGRDDAILTCVAELNHNKNHDFLLDAWQRLSPGCDSAHLLLVGNGENEVMLKRKVEREQIPRVYFLDYRKDVPQILQETDTVTLVSKQEGLPRCIMEAMAAGKPVVATNVRGSRDLVEDLKSGLLVELGDVKGLAVALEKLIASPNLRQSMGAAAKKKIQDYSLEKVLVEMAGIYDRYLK